MVVTRALALEGAILFAFGIAVRLLTVQSESAAENVLIALAALAMGMQSTAVRRLGVSGITTTVVTSTLAGVVEGSVGWLATAARSVAPAQQSTASEQTLVSSIPSPDLQALVFVTFGLGAVVGAVAELPWSLSAIWLPLGIILLVLLPALTRFRSRAAVAVCDQE